MIQTIKPYGAIPNRIRYRLEESGKYYVIDEFYNKIEIKKDDWYKLKAPIRKRMTPDEVQDITSR